MNRKIDKPEACLMCWTIDKNCIRTINNGRTERTSQWDTYNPQPISECLEFIKWSIALKLWVLRN